MDVYTKHDGIQVNKENMALITNRLIEHKNTLTVTCDYETHLLKIVSKFGGCMEFGFGEIIKITNESICKYTDNKEYIAYSLFEDMKGILDLHPAQNIREFTIQRPTELGVSSRIMIIDKDGNHFNTETWSSFIVFDKFTGDFVEIFESDEHTLRSAMFEHGYKLIR